jgi:hypothetical protein
MKKAQPTDLAHYLDVLVENYRDLLDSSDLRTRALAVCSFATGVMKLERGALNDMNAAGFTWAEIGEVYGVSRQAAHRRFAETVAPAQFFDELVVSLDEPAEVIPSLARASEKYARVAERS